MKITRIPFQETGLFPELLTRYLTDDPSLKPFYRYAPEFTSIASAMEDRRKTHIDRIALHDAIRKQYQHLEELDNCVVESLEAIKDSNTFTITTGHQLNIFTGPLYCIYKVLSVIRLSQQLNEMHPECRFVPVFWMASEDHDIAEINHFRVYGKEFKWEGHGSGPSGRLSTQGLSGLCDELSAILGESGKGLVDMFKKAYQANNRLADATRFIFNSIFGSYGLLIVDGDDVSLKKIFASHMLLELQEQRSAQALEITNRSFAEVGKLQINPRPINLFYMLDGFRERLEPDGSGGMKVLNSDLHFSKESLVSELNQHPERFSPNVTLRPLYQETILPNLAYIGGPGELNYWLQLKGVFESFGIFYPMVLMRSSFTLLDESTVNRIAKLGISNLELFKSKESLLFHLLERTGENIDVSDLNIQLNKAFDALKEQWLSIDATLEGSIEAERAKAMKSVQSLEEKARRALKRKHETLASQISKLKELVAPEGSPQERTDSFIGHDLRLAGHLIQSLLPLSSPFESVHLVVE